MNLLPSAFAGWLVSLTLVSAVLSLAAVVILRLMRHSSAGSRRLLIGGVILGTAVAAVSRMVVPAWSPGFVPLPAPVPLDGVVDRSDRELDGRPVPPEVAARIIPAPFLSGSQKESKHTALLLCGIWAGGALLCLSLRVAGVVRVCRLMRRSRKPEADDPIALEIEAACREAGLTIPRVRLSSEVSGPFMCGAGRFSWLVVPEDFGEEDPDSRAAAVQHELAHLRGYDSLLLSMVSLLVCIQWFNPLVHWLENRLALECEKTCDDAVLRHRIDPAHYAGLLLTLYQRHARAPGLAVTGGTRCARRIRSMMRERIQSLARAGVARSSPGKRLRLLLTVSALGCGIAAGAVRLQRGADWLIRITEEPLPAAEYLAAHLTMDSADEPAMRPVNVHAEARGRIDAALSFNGTDSYIDLDPAVLSGSPFPCTLCGWVRSGQTVDVQALVFAGSGKTNEYMVLSVNDGLAGLNLRSGNENAPLLGSQSVADGSWHHIAGVFHSARHRELYVDGRLSAAENVYRRPPQITRVQIGRNGRNEFTDFLHGEADDIRIYRTALDAAQIQSVMQAGRRLLAVPVPVRR